MFTLYATGNYSIKALTEKMYEVGLRSRAGSKVVKSRIHQLLSDPFYYGDFLWKGQLYAGKHEPIITKELFDEVQFKLNGGRPNPYYSKHLTEFRGKIHCGSCKKTVTWERQKGHWYGACKQCKAQLAKEKKYIRQESIEEELMTRMTAVAPQNDRVVEILRRALKESHAEETAYHDAQVQSINNKLERIQQRLRNMYDDKLDGRISASFYDEKARQFTQEKEDLLRGLDRLNANNTAYYRAGFAVHELALKASEIYLSEKANVEERRLLLAYSFSKVSVLKGKVKVEYTDAFEFLAKWMPRVNKSLEQTQNTAESYVSSGVLRADAHISPLELSEPREHSRTSKKSPVKPRHKGDTPISRPLLWGRDSNPQPMD